MVISAEKIGKRFSKHWIFRDVNLHIKSGESWAITGSNGSGKSTLLKILSGFMSPSEGKISHDGQPLQVDHFQPYSFVAPYLELPEEFTFKEFLDFHSTFRKKSTSDEKISEYSSLPLTKRIADFSTGMKLRAQLCTAFYFENQAIFMDEPTANLDEEGFLWWKNEIFQRKNITLLLASNSKDEIEVCNQMVSL